MVCYLVFLLQVWYAASYAEFVNQKIHDISEEERKGNLGSSALNFFAVWWLGVVLLSFKYTTYIVLPNFR